MACKTENSNEQLQNNIKIKKKIYKGLNIELIEEEFLIIPKFNVDIVFINPSFIIGKDLLNLEKDFECNIYFVIQKTILHTNNFVLILPTNIELKEIFTLISKCFQNSKFFLIF